MTSVESAESQLGEWLHDELVSHYGLETEVWATDRIRRITDRLNAVRGGAQQTETEVLWIPEMTAFTAPGGYAYISRELLQRAGDDDPIALTMAHEMAHHDLGHTRVFIGPLSGLRAMPMGLEVAAALKASRRFFLGPEKESAADAHGFDLCMRAGYDSRRCLELFDILEAYAMDHRDIEAVFGPDELDDSDSPSLGNALDEVRIWAWKRIRGYPCIRDRKEKLQKRAEELSSNC